MLFDKLFQKRKKNKEKTIHFYQKKKAFVFVLFVVSFLFRCFFIRQRKDKMISASEKKREK